MTGRMHDDEVPVDAELVHRLLLKQFPHWAALDLRPVASSGTDHAMFRLGSDLAVRLPRIHWAVGTLEREFEWLPRLAPALPVATPVPLAKGAPAHGFGWPWVVARWVEGRNPVVGALADAQGLAADLAGFIAAMRRLDLAGAPPTVWARPLHEEDGLVRELLPQVAHVIDAQAVRHAWQCAIDAPPCQARTWIHGDLAPGNLLLRDDRLVGVIDFSAMGAGDPASDLRPAWNLLPAGARDVLRDRLAVDDASWARGRGWVLLQALVQLPYYTDRNPALAANARMVLHQISAEVEAGLV